MKFKKIKTHEIIKEFQDLGVLEFITN